MDEDENLPAQCHPKFQLKKKDNKEKTEDLRKSNHS